MNNNAIKFTDKELRELRKSAMRALKHVAKSIKDEPATVIVTGDTNTSASMVDEIAKWLFHRRQEDGDKRN